MSNKIYGLKNVKLSAYKLCGKFYIMYLSVYYEHYFWISVNLLLRER